MGERENEKNKKWHAKEEKIIERKRESERESEKEREGGRENE